MMIGSSAGEHVVVPLGFVPYSATKGAVKILTGAGVEEVAALVAFVAGPESSLHYRGESRRRWGNACLKRHQPRQGSPESEKGSGTGGSQEKARADGASVGSDH